MMNRIVLLDVSRKLLFGEELARTQAYSSNKPFEIFKERDLERELKIVAYMKKMGILDHEDILFIDTAYHGTIIENLREIIEKHNPGKKITGRLFQKSDPAPRSIKQVPGLGIWQRRSIIRMLEFGKSPGSLAPSSHSAQTTEEFEGWHPKYKPATLESIKLAQARDSIIRKHLDRYVWKKG